MFILCPVFKELTTLPPGGRSESIPLPSLFPVERFEVSPKNLVSVFLNLGLIMVTVSILAYRRNQVKRFSSKKEFLFSNLEKDQRNGSYNKPEPLRRQALFFTSAEKMGQLPRANRPGLFSNALLVYTPKLKCQPLKTRKSSFSPASLPQSLCS